MLLFARHGERLEPVDNQMLRRPRRIITARVGALKVGGIPMLPNHRDQREGSQTQESESSFLAPSARFEETDGIEIAHIRTHHGHGDVVGPPLGRECCIETRE